MGPIKKGKETKIAGEKVDPQLALINKTCVQEIFSFRQTHDKWNLSIIVTYSIPIY